MNRLRYLRESKEISQAELAKIWNTSASAISAWENEANQMDYKTLKRAADFYETSIDYILCRDALVGANEQEEKLLSAYRNMNNKKQKLLMNLTLELKEL